MQAMICITPAKGKQAPQGRHTQGHFPQIAFCKRDIKCLLVGGHTHSHIDTQLYATVECFFLLERYYVSSVQLAWSRHQQLYILGPQIALLLAVSCP